MNDTKTAKKIVNIDYQQPKISQKYN